VGWRHGSATPPVVELAGQTIKMAVTARTGAAAVAGVIFYSDRGSTYTAYDFTGLCDEPHRGVLHDPGGSSSIEFCKL
jgi:transposase InsO family protein